MKNFKDEIPYLKCNFCKKRNMKGEINTAANFQAEDLESKNATDLDCLANSLNSLNAKSAEIKDKRNDVPFSSRKSNSHVLELFLVKMLRLTFQMKHLVLLGVNQV